MFTLPSDLLDQHGIRLNVVGNKALFPPRLQEVARKAEEMTAKRRAERKQFKLDRARAIAAVAAEAEALFETEGRVVVPALSGPNIPSAATWRPTPQEQPEISTPATPNEEGPLEEPFPEDVEHLQLTLPEAFFLLWNLDCLAVEDADTVRCSLF